LGLSLVRGQPLWGGGGGGVVGGLLEVSEVCSQRQLARECVGVSEISSGSTAPK